MHDAYPRRIFFLRLCLVAILLPLSLIPVVGRDQVNSSLSIGRIHYDGGGDWYGNKTSLANMLAYFARTTGADVAAKEDVVRLEEISFYNYPLLYIAGHGNIRFSRLQAQNLRRYLSNGGFLFADDDYGMDVYFRREMKKVFPELEFSEIPFSDSLYHRPFDFTGGAPKIHEHDGGQPRIFGLYYRQRLICLYTWNTDISDGCEDPGIHDDSEAVRQQALQFSTNILYRALVQ
jgi:hypothetical protein